MSAQVGTVYVPLLGWTQVWESKQLIRHGGRHLDADNVKGASRRLVKLPSPLRGMRWGLRKLFPLHGGGDRPKLSRLHQIGQLLRTHGSVKYRAAATSY
jgi:hypothetical protein